MTDNEWKGANFSQEEDHSEETDKLLEKINATTIPVLLRSRNESLDDILSELLVLEKTARLGGDTTSNKKLAVEVLRIYRTQKELDKMLTCLDELMRKRAQPKQVQSAMIAECAVTLHDGSLSEEKQIEVLERLAHVADNKIHVELEHARFTIELAGLQEKKGNKRAAYDLLRVLHIETITNMPRLEKLEALNNQIRLCLELGEYEHTPMVSRKINYRALAREESLQQKILYFELMRQYYVNRRSHFNVARCWLETYLTLKQVDEKLEALSNAVVHYLIAEHDTPKELEDLAECCAFSPETKFEDRPSALKGLCEKRKSDLEDLPRLYYVLQRFNSIELIRARVSQDVATLCATHPALAAHPDRQQLLQDRCSEHDLVVISHFYTRLPLTRLGQLVHLTPEHVEAFLMVMVGNNTLYAKIDRVDGLVVFEEPKDASAVVASWNSRVNRSVALLDKVSHLITKERMLFNLQNRNNNSDNNKKDSATAVKSAS
ncbi:26S proteasome regulatory subunit N5 [Angomonas deanei]|uniref:PCI domain containing protein, putative n=1 Tax=Angomonas deanei TaxID=59799 RepID=S9VQI4_9TRYP|nr:26S proteasome regulatory subunit N5 [Angomonas deanei]EPY43148.1 26S proteasome regulatory subunit N5 [Angomonas deanei]CAD2220972.1 PCI domain containing protein, putative [Angomonas deanei]|eukprot:EPY24284.1 26S proteasome regulatory subunit N5 [Angomonas deanei]